MTQTPTTGSITKQVQHRDPSGGAKEKHAGNWAVLEGDGGTELEVCFSLLQSFEERLLLLDFWVDIFQILCGQNPFLSTLIPFLRNACLQVSKPHTHAVVGFHPDAHTGF